MSLARIRERQADVTEKMEHLAKDMAPGPCGDGASCEGGGSRLHKAVDSISRRGLKLDLA